MCVGASLCGYLCHFTAEGTQQVLVLKGACQAVVHAVVVKLPVVSVYMCGVVCLQKNIV